MFIWFFNPKSKDFDKAGVHNFYRILIFLVREDFSQGMAVKGFKFEKIENQKTFWDDAVFFIKKMKNLTEIKQ